MLSGSSVVEFQRNLLHCPSVGALLPDYAVSQPDDSNLNSKFIIMLQTSPFLT